MANKVIIDIKSLGITWVPGNSYTVNVGQGFVNQAGVDKLPNSAQSNLVTFTTPATGPSVASVIPAYNSTGITNTNIQLTYNRGQVFRNTGNFYIYRQSTPSDVLVATIPVTSASVSGNVLTLPLLGTLDGGYTYYITADAGIIKDVYDFQSIVINSSAVIKFTTDEYNITSVTPAHNATDSYNTTITITFEREPVANVGNFYLYKNGSLIQTISATDYRVTTSGNNVNIDLLGLLEGENSYYLLSDFGVIRDVSRFNFKGMPDDSTIKFSTGLRPYISATNPVNNATDVYDLTPTLAINRSFTRKTGNFYIYSDTNPDTLIATIPVNDSKVTVSGNDITIDLLGVIDGEITYYITADEGILEDQYKFTFKGISDDTVLKFSTGLRPRIIATDPVNNATNVADSAINLNTNRTTITRRTGNFYLYDNSTSALVATIPITDSRVKISQDIITIDLYNIIELQKTYYITSDEKIFEDQFKFTFKGIPNNNSTLKFTTSNKNIYKIFYPTYAASDVDIDTDYMIVSEESTFGGSNNPGQAFIYSTTTRELLHTLVNPSPSSSSPTDKFGYSAAISNSYAIVGAYLEDDASGTDSGKAYIYSTTTGQLLYTLDNTAVVGESTANNYFGYSVDISNTHAIVGAYQKTTNQGAYSGKAFIYSTTTGQLLYTLNDPNAYGTSDYDNFGYSVAISGNYAIVGAYREDDAGGTDSGKAYIYSLTNGQLLYTLNNPNPVGASSNDYFGYSVDISNTHAIVGAYQEDDASASNSGKAYIYSTTTGQLLYTLNDPNAYGTGSNDEFGRAVAISGNYAIVGAAREDSSTVSNLGKAYIYSLANGSLVYTLDNPRSAQSFGSVVSITNNYALISDLGRAYFTKFV